MIIHNQLNQLKLNESQILRQWNILCGHVAKFNNIKGPRTGDFVRFASGEMRRICVLHFDGDFQVTPTKTSGSFNIDGGACDYSGTCGEGFNIKILRFTHTYELGHVWFFKDAFPQAHSGVDAEIPMRVYDTDEELNK